MTTAAPFHHLPVLADEVVAALLPHSSGGSPAGPGVPIGGFDDRRQVECILVDCTLGGGGHSEALLSAAPACLLIGLDRDAEAIAAARRRLAGFAGRVTVMQRRFGQLAAALADLPGGGPAPKVAGILYDLGVSSVHLDEAGRGFSYRLEAPLDMRMDPTRGISAADVVNGYPEAELAQVLARFGEERFARRIAGAVVRRRASRLFDSTTDLADVVRSAIPAATRRTGPHPARRTFQALRIEVNDELGELSASIPQAIDALAPGGRVAVISYHSLEDRIAKRAFASAAAGCSCPKDLPVCVCGARATLRLVTRRPIVPTPAEVQSNPRAASARLRVAERVETREVA